MGVLPFFHSFGFTGTLWLPLIGGFGAVYHANPLDAKTIGGAGREVPGDVPDLDADLLLRPTTAQVRAARSSPSLRYVVVGAEKLREPDRRRVPGEVRARPAGRLRLHRDVAGGRGQRARRLDGPRHADRQQARHRRTPAARRRRAGSSIPETGAAAAAPGRKGCCW